MENYMLNLIEHLGGKVMDTGGKVMETIVPKKAPTNVMNQADIGSWNAGPGTPSDIRKLIARMGSAGILALQEMGGTQGRNLLAASREAGWNTLSGDYTGADHTPVIIGPDVKVLHRTSILLLRSQNLGPGAGPDTIINKGAVGALVRANGVTFGVASLHYPASQQFAPRMVAAESMSRSTVAAFADRQFPWFLCGDFNAVPDSKAIKPLYNAGWTNNQKVRYAPTHGRRAIDYVWWRKADSVRLLSQSIINNGSDHRAVIARFQIGGGTKNV